MNFKKFISGGVAMLTLLFPLSAVFAQNVTVSQDVTINLPGIGRDFILKSTSTALDQISVNAAGTAFTVVTNLSSGTVTITQAQGLDMGGNINSLNLALTSCGDSLSTLTIQANITAAVTVTVTPSGAFCTSGATPSPSSGPGGAGGGGGGTTPSPTPTPTPEPTTEPGEEPIPTEGEEPVEAVLTFEDLLDFAALQTHWCFLFCQKAHDEGVITGRVDIDGQRTYAPNDLMNRAELAKVAVTTAAMTALISATGPFPDVDDANIWYFGWVNRAKMLGFVTGYADGNFYPANFITRGEVAVVFARMTGEDLPDCDETIFTDVKAGDFACQYVTLMKQLNFMRGDVDAEGNLLGTFRPNDYITRGEIAVVVSKFRSQ